MNNLLQLNKKGVSIMVGYVLLIAIAVALSTAVFFYLKLYIPSDKQDCYQDINLVIDSVTCKYNSISGNSPSTSTIYLNMTNKGFFSVDGAFIKIGDADRILRKPLNKPDDGLKSKCNNFENSLKPEKTFCESYNYDSAPTTEQEITIQPLIWIENKPILCPEAIVSRKITCTP